MPVYHTDEAMDFNFWLLTCPEHSKYGKDWIELRPDGNHNKFTVNYPYAYKSRKDAETTLDKYVKGEIIPANYDSDYEIPDVGFGRVAKLTLRIIPITLSQTEVTIGRGLAAFNQANNNAKTAIKSAVGHNSFLPNIKCTMGYHAFWQTMVPETAHHHLIFGVASFLNPSTEQTIIDSFREAAKQGIRHAADPAIDNFRRSAGYSRTDINGVLEDIPFEHFGRWMDMKDPTTTSLFKVVLFELGEVRDLDSEQEEIKASNHRHDEHNDRVLRANLPRLSYILIREARALEKP